MRTLSRIFEFLNPFVPVTGKNLDILRENENISPDKFLPYKYSFDHRLYGRK